MDGRVPATRRIDKRSQIHEEADNEKQSANNRYQTSRLFLKWHCLHNIALSLFEICKLIGFAARDGQKLPILTVVVVIHAVVHGGLFTFGTNGATTGGFATKTASIIVLSINLCIIFCGYVLLILLYRHSVRNIFNKKIPSSLAGCIPSFGVHLSLLKPLEILFRYITAKFRVLPDIIVLGEVRCGTTTLCNHLSLLSGCHTPFCLWKHPELDNKDTFYFVGHFLCQVDPRCYSMCFPLKVTKWFHETVLRRPFFTFDGSAQYLTSPSGPYLIAQAYRIAGQPPPILVVCARDPVDQAISWWKYENNAMAWANNMGLSEWNTDLRSSSYPPLTFSAAMDFSSSHEVEDSYRAAEHLFRKFSLPNYSSQAYVLPPWAMTWPSGQLSTIGRSGAYIKNILRYEHVFSEAFGTQGTAGSCKVPTSSKFQYVNVVPLEYLAEASKIRTVLRSIDNQLAMRGQTAKRNEKLLHTPNIHRNRVASMPSNLDLEPTPSDKQRLADIFIQDNIALEEFCGIRLGWD